MLVEGERHYFRMKNILIFTFELLEVQPPETFYQSKGVHPYPEVPLFCPCDECAPSLECCSFVWGSLVDNVPIICEELSSMRCQGIGVAVSWLSEDLSLFQFAVKNVDTPVSLRPGHLCYGETNTVLERGPGTEQFYRPQEEASEKRRP